MFEKVRVCPVAAKHLVDKTYRLINPFHINNTALYLSNDMFRKGGLNATLGDVPTTWDESVMLTKCLK